jgi:hypothetical protein
VGHVGIHDEYKVASGVLDTVDVCGTEAEFACTGAENDAVGTEGLLELFGDFKCSVGRGVVDDDDFKFEIAVD